MRRRPWWLIADGPGRAWVNLAFPAFFLLMTVRRDGLDWLDVLALAVFSLFLGLAVATLLAFRRHPDWVGRAWAPGRGSRWWFRYGRRTYLAAMGVGLGVLLVGIVLVVTGTGGLGATVVAVGLLVAVVAGLGLSVADAFGPGGIRDTERDSDRTTR